MIQDFYQRGIELLSLKPSPETNRFFTELCEYTRIDDYEDIVITDQVLRLNTISALAEYELEKYWNTKILSASDPRKELQNFIHYTNYIELIGLEMLNTKHFFDDIKHILFVGGGPLPLTSIVLALEYGIRSTIIDSSEEAVLLSKKLVTTLGLEDMISIELGDARTYKSDIHFDLCYLASLIFVGDDSDIILRNTSTLDVDNFLIRTSINKRQLLYKKVDEKILHRYLTPIIILHPKNNIINSFILSTKHNHE